MLNSAHFLSTVSLRGYSKHIFLSWNEESLQVEESVLQQRQNAIYKNRHAFKECGTKSETTVGYSIQELLFFCPCRNLEVKPYVIQEGWKDNTT